MAARGRGRASAVLRGAHESARAVHILFSGGATLVPHAAATEPDRSYHLGADAAAHSVLAASGAHYSSLSPEATWRCHLRQAPDAALPHVRLRGGGYEQSSSLLRLRGEGAFGPALEEYSSRPDRGMASSSMDRSERQRRLWNAEKD